MNKKLNSTFCTLAVTAMVSVAMLSGCSGTTAAPGASDTDQASTTAVAGGEEYGRGVNGGREHRCWD